jgi:hypothetical protein
MVRVERSTFLKLRQLKKRRRCRSMNALILKLVEEGKELMKDGSEK